ncbi:MAG: tetratricopeptide repeat protein [Desulfobulbaceae bacterium]|nr:tetratricopeptide repeat protein [Desulfobulbaceae bacterium]
MNCQVAVSHAHAWGGKGVALSNLGCYEEAIDAFNKALDIKPDHEAALCALGVYSLSYWP